jgi:hypothetical protein
MINLISQDIYSESSVQLHKLGALGIDQYGNRYRYVQNGGVALVTGNLLQEAAEDTNFRSVVVNTAGAIGTDEVEVTLGGTAVTANQFDEGQLVIESGTGVGQLFRIKRHDVQTSTTGSCTFVLDRPLKIATVATTSQASVRKNAFDGVIQWPTTPTGAPVGIALYAMTIAYFGWIQSGGEAVALFDNTDNSAADAEGIIPSATVAGSVKAALAADVADRLIGWSREEVSVDSTMGFVHLIID